jgi:hypothetical protein
MAKFALLSSVRVPAISLLAVVVLVVAGGVAGCGSDKKPKILDTERVERAIQDSILQKRHLKATVSCPAGIEQKKGVTFRCTATYRGGQNPFVVTVDSSKGAVHYVGVGR